MPAIAARCVAAAATWLGVALAGTALAGTACPTAAQAQALRGRVSDAVTLRPLPQVSVSLYSDSLQLLGEVRTDSTGDFLLRLPRPGSYHIMPRKIGFFGNVVGPLVMATRDTFELLVQVAPVAMTIRGVEVSASREPHVDFTRGFEARRARGVGTFVTREEIDKRPASRTLDLLRGLSGVSVIDDDGSPGFNELIVVSNRGARTMGSHCRMAMIVDGLQVDNAQINRTYRPSDFEAIEVYAASTLPLQYSQMGSECGAILFWTRWEARKERKASP